MKTLEMLKTEIAQTEALIKDLQKEIDNFELDPSEFESQFIDLLDEETVRVVGISFTPSSILQELDPIAYNCELTYYVNNLDLSESAEYRGLETDLESADYKLENLEIDLEDLENELEDELED